jgi:hypothetical protein
MKNLFLVVAIMACGVLTSFAVPAAAIPPAQGSFDHTDKFIDSEGCSFPFEVTQHNYGFYEVFFNEDGSFAKAIVHEKQDVLFSANGKTLLERDTWQTIVEPGGVRIIGLFSHIQGPDGLVLRDAGQLAFDANDNLLYVHGPHPQFFGASFCAGLTP